MDGRKGIAESQRLFKTAPAISKLSTTPARSRQRVRPDSSLPASHSNSSFFLISISEYSAVSEQDQQRATFLLRSRLPSPTILCLTPARIGFDNLCLRLRSEFGRRTRKLLASSSSLENESCKHYQPRIFASANRITSEKAGSTRFRKDD